MITMCTPVDLDASAAVRVRLDHPALSEVRGSVASASFGRRVIRGAFVVRTQPATAPRTVQHDDTGFGISTKVQDPARGVPV